MVEPLKKKTMTLDQLQRETLKLIKLMRRHLSTPAHAPSAMSDCEFNERFLEPLHFTRGSGN